MRYILNSIASVVLLGFALAAAAHPVQRTVLVETFTNVSCLGCAGANAVTQDVCTDMGNHEVLNLQYHISWPEPSDPFYLVDPVDNTVRTFLYGIGSAPDLITAGVNTPAPADYAALVAAVDAHKDELTPLVVAVEQTLVGTDLTVDVNVKAVDTTTASTRSVMAEPSCGTSPMPSSASVSKNSRRWPRSWDRSDPVTRTPRAAQTWAKPLMPMPPTPMKW